MSENNSRPKDTAPVIVMREEPSDMGRYMLLMLPSLFGSVLFHAALIAAFVAYVWFIQPAPVLVELQEKKNETITADQIEEKKETFTVTDVDPAAVEFDTNIQYMADRIADVSVPGTVNPNEAVGIKDGDKSAQPVSLPAPGGFLTKGQGGALDTLTGPTNSKAIGDPGGYSPKGMPLQGTFYGRSGATREYALREGGGTTESEAAVARGLQWLIRQQLPSGAWSMNAGADSNEIAATALGLLPFLAAGKTHKAAKDNPYDKKIDRALKFLMRSQDKKGYFTGGMYAHGLATIAICEAYGLTQDPLLRRSAQSAVNLLVATQHEGGGWRYGPNKTPGDLSVSGWQIMGLKSGMMAGLTVPTLTVERAKTFLNSSMNTSDKGYGYVPAATVSSTYRMTAVGLLCRQYLQNWGPSNPEMIEAVNRHIKTRPPTFQDVYYYYYATQVMHHFGGEAWKEWNDRMRETLIKKQEKNEKSPNFGSWSPEGDPWARVGGRLMITSLNLLTLEVYYRYLPLYYRDAGYKMDKAVQNGV